MAEQATPEIVITEPDPLDIDLTDETPPQIVGILCKIASRRLNEFITEHRKGLRAFTSEEEKIFVARASNSFTPREAYFRLLVFDVGKSRPPHGSRETDTSISQGAKTMLLAIKAPVDNEIAYLKSYAEMNLPPSTTANLPACYSTLIEDFPNEKSQRFPAKILGAVLVAAQEVQKATKHQPAA